jgi:hypothetical protein
MLTGQLVQRLRLFYQSKTIFVRLLPLSDEPSERLLFLLYNSILCLIHWIPVKTFQIGISFIEYWHMLNAFIIIWSVSSKKHIFQPSEQKTNKD